MAILRGQESITKIAKILLLESDVDTPSKVGERATPVPVLGLYCRYGRRKNSIEEESNPHQSKA